MIEMRWVLISPKDTPPPLGAVCVGEQLYQKLQYRYPVSMYGPKEGWLWSEWLDVPVVTP